MSLRDQHDQVDMSVWRNDAGDYEWRCEYRGMEEYGVCTFNCHALERAHQSANNLIAVYSHRENQP